MPTFTGPDLGTVIIILLIQRIFDNPVLIHIKILMPAGRLLLKLLHFQVLVMMVSRRFSCIFFNTFTRLSTQLFSGVGMS